MVGIIATIRRILLVTLQTSDRPTIAPASVSADSTASFHDAMIELSVLGLLTLVLAFAIYLSRRSKA